MNHCATFRCVVLASSLSLALLANAHHSFAVGYQMGVTSELEGEITELRWINPHVLFTLKTTDANGAPKLHSIQTHSVSVLRRLEIPTNALSVGQHVRLAGHPENKGGAGMFVTNALLPTGLEIVFEPTAKPLWGTRYGTTKNWQATLDSAERSSAGIFRVWSTSLTDPLAFPYPEKMNPAHVFSYPLTPSALAAAKAFNPVTDVPTLNCAPKGMPAIMEQPYPMEFKNLGDRIQLRIEESDAVRMIHMNPAQAVAAKPSNLGYSVGHWQGSSLVVETTQMNWGHFDTSGIPLSTNAKVVEYFIPSADDRSMDYRMIVTDASTFTKPVELKKRWLAIPGASVEPYNCTN